MPPIPEGLRTNECSSSQTALRCRNLQSCVISHTPREANMSDAATRRYRAGDNLEDLCRVCKAPRSHTVVAADSEGRIQRVICDYCGSQHLYRGWGIETPASKPSAGSTRGGDRPFELVSERERRLPPMRIEA